jgi:galactose oxidase
MARVHTRVRLATAAAALLAIVSVVAGAPGAQAAVEPHAKVVPTDSYSSIVGFRTADGMYAAPIDIAVMPSGKVFLLGVDSPTYPTTIGAQEHVSWEMTPDPVGATLPATTTVTPIQAPVDDDMLQVGNRIYDDMLVCGGLTFMQDGSLMVAGGPRTISDAATGKPLLITGVPYGTTFTDTSWTRLPGNMTGVGGYTTGRWYPTLTRLADGRILVTGGYDVLLPIFSANTSEEIFDPAAGTWTTISTRAQAPPQTHDADYTAVFQLPTRVGGADVLMIGEDGRPIFMNSSTTPATWRLSNDLRPGAVNGAIYSNGAGTTMLPIRLKNGQWGYDNGSILTMSGLKGTTAMTRADIYDPVTDTWLPSIDTGTPRHYPAPVLLPDGRVLLINGHDYTPDDSVLTPQYVDPANGFAVTTSPASGVEVRGYHNVAALLPDGRIMVAGGRDIDRDTTTEKPDYAYFSPSYMFQPRPVITSGPDDLGYGQSASVTSSTVKPVDAVLMGLPSMTHSFDSNQRYVQLKMTVTDTGSKTATETIKGPANSSIAPPGYYMLFLLDSHRVPSVAKIIRIG